MLLVIAFRNIWRNKARSIIIMLSVAVGLFAGTAVIALYKGMLRSRVRTLIELETGHIQIHARDFLKSYAPALVLPDCQSLLQVTRKIPGVKIAAPRSITQGMLSTPTGSAGVQINGVQPETEYLVSQLKKKIKSGRGFTPGKKNEILVGKKLADKMKLKPGAKLVLTFTDTSENIVAGAFRVAGIYQSANAPLDERNVYLKMEDLNNLLGTGPSFHEIVLLLDDDNAVNAVQQTLKKNFPGYSIESWKEISPETELMVDTIDYYSFIIIIIIMLALAFGIINTMLMAILERTKEIGLMTALGMNRSRLFMLILMETLFLTIAGTPAGILTGWPLISHFNKTGLDLSSFGKDLLSSFGYSAVIYPEYPWDRLLAILCIVIGTALVSCIFPAVKALRLKPVEALQR